MCIRDSYPLAAFLVLLTIGDLLRRLGRARQLGAVDREPPGHRPVRAAVAHSLGQALATAAIALPVAFITYLASWIGWIVTPGGSGLSLIHI